MITGKVYAEDILIVSEDMTARTLCQVLDMRHPGAEVIAMWHDLQSQTVRLRVRMLMSFTIPQYDQAQIDAVVESGNMPRDVTNDAGK